MCFGFLCFVNSGDVVYGPLPKEPMEKLYSDYIKPKSAVKSL